MAPRDKPPAQLPFLLLYMYVIVLRSTHVHTAAEFETPVSTTVPQDTTAVFTCRATGVAWLDWFVDGRVASNRVIKERGFRYETTSSHGVIHSVLNALASQANNGTSVHCEVSGGQVSPPAILTVQGLLSVPGDFKVQYQDEDRIQFGWKLPFTQDSVPILSIKLYYSEVLFNTTGVIELPGDSMVYDFRIPRNGSRPDSCISYVFHVAATNEVGEGGHSSAIEVYPLTDPEPVHTDDVQVTITFIGLNKTTVTFSFQEVSCRGQPTESYAVNMTCGYAVFSEPNPRVSREDNHTVVEFEASSDVLPTNNIYAVVIVAVNPLGSVQSNGTITASTFDVQDAKVELQEQDSLLCLSCDFSKGSSAKGCLAVVMDLGFTLAALRSPDSDDLTAMNCSTFSAGGGRYQVLVYDLESDGTQPDNPAISTMLFVHEKEEKKDSFLLTTKTVIICCGGFALCFVLIVLVVSVFVAKRRHHCRVHAKAEERVYDTIPDTPLKKDLETDMYMTENSAYGHSQATQP